MTKLLVALLPLLTGCAWVFKGSKQDVRFESTPDRADVRVDSRYLGTTPTHGEIDRNQGQNIRVSLPGHGEQYARIQRHPDTAWWFWDISTCVIPVTLCIPLLVDAISGSWFSLDDEVRVKLDPAPPGSAPPVYVPVPVAVPAPAPSQRTMD